ncbi:MgtC/SapB family protein [Telmatospirillum sp. J64-1]|uniref:MgtC/SapB family protein n=1 Tax=Telmatospirillum sp. J64-1 TaxID=2502183 RepID=UPI00115DCB55|nr:MgtC/SapB family protein [Telmatospirillum sp. J64-1]
MEIELATNADLYEIVTRLGLAVLLGMLLGLDRELNRKPAGLRTSMLVSLGAALTTLVAFELYYSVDELKGSSQADPLRAIEGVVGAIGFLGAGVIIQGRGRVQHMTTAANIWICGTIGLACGGGFYVVAIIAFIFAIVILTVLRWVEHLFIQPKQKE